MKALRFSLEPPMILKIKYPAIFPTTNPANPMTNETIIPVVFGIMVLGPLSASPSIWSMLDSGVTFLSQVTQKLLADRSDPHIWQCKDSWRIGTSLILGAPNELSSPTVEISLSDSIPEKAYQAPTNEYRRKHHHTYQEIGNVFR